jgi:hypothetical protein
LAEAALGKGGMQRQPADEAWATYRSVLARLPDTGGALAVAQEAYDAFAHLDAMDLGAGYSHIADDEFNAAIVKAKKAEMDLNSLAFWIEGPRARFQIGGMFDRYE